MITTERLILRPWQHADKLPFACMNADPRVAEFLSKCLTTEESNQLVERINKHFEEHGFGLWATALKDSGQFIGFIGLNIPSFSAPFTPCVEIGWRLAYEFWGKGYATEGAKAVLEYAFNALALDEVVSFTTVNNLRSQKVMQKIGMQRDPNGDFRHPQLPTEHPLSRHVLYRIKLK